MPDSGSPVEASPSRISVKKTGIRMRMGPDAQKKYQGGARVSIKDVRDAGLDIMDKMANMKLSLGEITRANDKYQIGFITDAASGVGFALVGAFETGTMAGGSTEAKDGKKPSLKERRNSKKTRRKSVLLGHRNYFIARHGTYLISSTWDEIKDEASSTCLYFRLSKPFVFGPHLFQDYLRGGVQKIILLFQFVWLITVFLLKNLTSYGKNTFCFCIFIAFVLISSGLIKMIETNNDRNNSRKSIELRSGNDSPPVKPVTKSGIWASITGGGGALLR